LCCGQRWSVKRTRPGFAKRGGENPRNKKVVTQRGQKKRRGKGEKKITDQGNGHGSAGVPAAGRRREIAMSTTNEEVVSDSTEPSEGGSQKERMKP